jgi:hypothetical protein
MMGRIDHLMNVSTDLRVEQVPGDNHAVREVNEAGAC